MALAELASLTETWDLLSLLYANVSSLTEQPYAAFASCASVAAFVSCASAALCVTQFFLRLRSCIRFYQPKKRVGRFIAHRTARILLTLTCFHALQQSPQSYLCPLSEDGWYVDA